MGSKFDINDTIRRLTILKEEIDEQVAVVQKEQDKFDLGLETDSTKVDAARDELKRKIALIDKNIINNIDVSKILTENSSAELVAVIDDLTSKAFQENLTKQGGIDEKTAKTDTAKTMEQLNELGDSEETAKDQYKYGTFDERFEDAKKLVEEKNKYDKYEEIKNDLVSSGKLAKNTPLRDYLNGFTQEAEIYLDVAENIENAEKYDFKKETDKLYNKPIDKSTEEDWKKLCKILSVLEGLPADVNKNVRINGSTVQLSDLYDKKANTVSSLLTSCTDVDKKRILETIHADDFIKKASEEFKKIDEKNKNEFVKNIDEHKELDMFEITNSNGSKQSISENMKAAVKDGKSSSDIRKLVEDAAKMDNLELLAKFEKVNPDKYKNAEAQLQKLQTRYESGIKYDGKYAEAEAVRELDLSEQLGLTDKVKIVNDEGKTVDATKLTDDKLQEIVETTFASLNDDMPSITSKIASENKNLPRNIPVFSWIKKHVFGQPTKRDLAIQDEIKNRIKNEIQNKTEASKAKANGQNELMKEEKDNAFALDKESMEKFRKAEREIIIKNKGGKSADEVNKEARAEADR